MSRKPTLAPAAIANGWVDFSLMDPIKWPKSQPIQIRIASKFPPSSLTTFSTKFLFQNHEKPSKMFRKRRAKTVQKLPTELRAALPPSPPPPPPPPPPPYSIPLNLNFMTSKLIEKYSISHIQIHGHTDREVFNKVLVSKVIKKTVGKWRMGKKRKGRPPPSPPPKGHQ